MERRVRDKNAEVSNDGSESLPELEYAASSVRAAEVC